MRLWLPCVTMMLMSIIQLIDRTMLAVLAPTILADTHLINLQYGWIMSVSSLVFMAANPLWGRLLDRTDLWIGVFAAVALWSVASMLNALVITFAGFMAVRALLAFGEGAALPGGVLTVMRTLSPDRHARGLALFLSGGPVGATLAPLVATPVALRFGWRAAFVLAALLGAAWLILWWRFSRNPRLHEIVQPIVQEPVSLSDLRLWGFVAIFALGGAPLAFVLYTTPLYLHQALSQSQADLGLLLVIPPLGSAGGYFFWGWLVDRLLARTSDPMTMYRRLIVMLMLLGLTLAATPLLTRISLVMCELFFAMFVFVGFTIVSLSYATTQVFSTRQGGFISGIGIAAWSAMMAVTMPLFGWLLDIGAYESMFLIATLMPCIGCALWWGSGRNVRCSTD